MKKKWLFLFGILVLALLLAGCLERVKAPADSETEKPASQEKRAGVLTAHFMDVGQGDATLFETEDYAILIDTGNWNDTDAVDYLEELGVSKLDIVVGTHPDQKGRMKKTGGGAKCGPFPVFFSNVVWQWFFDQFQVVVGYLAIQVKVCDRCRII